MDASRWDDVRTFLAVARQGTLTRASETLGVHASTIHRRITALEEGLDVRLFERDPRGYVLTAVGEALLPAAEEVEEAMLALRRTATGHDRSATGEVVLTLPETLLAVVAPHLPAVRAQCPGLVPVLRTDGRLLELGREADLALRPSVAPPEDAVGRRIGTLAWAVYAPAATHAPDALPWVGWDGMDAVPAVAWQRARGIEPAARVGEVNAALRLVLTGAYRAILPCYLGDATPGLVRLGAPVPEAETPLWLLIHADLRRSARVRALVDVLVPRLEAERGRFAGER